MKLKISFFTIILSALSFSCSDYEEINVNPNEPTEVSASVLLPAAIRQSVNTSTLESFLLGNNAAQLTAKTLRTEVDDYNWNAFPTVWEGFYESLTDVDQVERLAIQNENAQLEAVAIIMRSWIFSNLTNAYGDIPYTESIGGSDNNFTPGYDRQEQIYADLLSELERANGLLQGTGSISGDILLDNDAERWRKFCNSLRLRLLMYASNQLPDAGSRFANIVNNEPILSTNADNVALPYLSTFPNQFPTIPLKTGDFDAVALSATSLGVMSAYNDPRLSRYARPDNGDYTNPSFSGAENGAGTCQKGGSRLGADYFLGESQSGGDVPGFGTPEGLIITVSEVEFLLAEAIAKGWLSGNLEEHYRNGIEASMEYYQVNFEPFGYLNFDDYYNNSGVAYSTTTDIWEQKWLALFFTGLEPYFEVRRWYHESGMSFDGIPFMSAACNNLNNGNLPLRFLYPGEEQSLNQANYAAAIENLDGGNSINASTWITD